MLKVLITGGGGLLGQYINIAVSGRYETLTVYGTNKGNCGDFNNRQADLTNFSELSGIWREFMPDVTIHTAALSRPEICEALSLQEVRKVNVQMTENLASLSAENGSLLIFTSTDLVYDGNSGGMLSEDAKINPESRYAESKVLAEEAVRRKAERHVILRTSLLYGLGLNHSTNNFDATYRKFLNGETASLFRDQYRTPLALHDAADLISRIPETFSTNETLNFGGKERVSRAGLGEKLCEAAGFDTRLIKSISMDEITGLIKVPDVSMNTDRLNSFGLHQQSIEESIKQILENK